MLVASHMMERPLLISSILDYGEKMHGGQMVVSRDIDGSIFKYSVTELAARVKKLANAIASLGITTGQTIATLAWNTHRHLELYYTIPATGNICHTLNPRLDDNQLIKIINHAEDEILFVDIDLLPRVVNISPKCPSIKEVIVLSDAQLAPNHSELSAQLPKLIWYEQLIEPFEDSYQWPEFPETTAASLCYTSGTTGSPKGILFSHRSCVLQSLYNLAPGLVTVNMHQSLFVAVPMFHVNAWCKPFQFLITGCKILLPGPHLDGKSIQEMISQEEATSAFGVPTVWLAYLKHIEEAGQQIPSSLKSIVIGGAPVPANLEQSLSERGVNVIPGMGMTESSAGIAMGNHTHAAEDTHSANKADELTRIRLSYGTEVRIVDASNHPLPFDGQTQGELCLKGNAVISAYYRNSQASSESFDDEGWFHTGDVACIDPEGRLKITDRIKDLIKSGGEWINSVELENQILAHSDIREAAAIAIPHPKWGERAALVITMKEGATPLSLQQTHDFLLPRVPKWWLPEQIIVVSEMPYTSTGKISKVELRKGFQRSQDDNEPTS